jgi:Tfp pilus assembly protein FimT
MTIRREPNVESRAPSSLHLALFGRPRPSTLWRGEAKRRRLDPRHLLGAYTLMEIMIVVGIIGLIMSAGVPTLYHALRREGTGRVTGELQELFSAARARAILQGSTAQIVFYPRERRCELVAGSGGSPGTVIGLGGTPRAVRLGDNVRIEMLDVNLLEYKDSESARVHFFPNGTSDEMTLILHWPERDQWRKITLEITTALASLESDPDRWRRGR